MAGTAENVIRGARRLASANGVDIVRLRKKLDRSLRDARKSASRGMRMTDGYVHKHPWRAVGVAAGAVALAGIVLALAARRQRPEPGSLTHALEDVRRAALSRIQGMRR